MEDIQIEKQLAQQMKKDKHQNLVRLRQRRELRELLDLKRKLELAEKNSLK